MAAGALSYGGHQISGKEGDDAGAALAAAAVRVDYVPMAPGLFRGRAGFDVTGQFGGHLEVMLQPRQGFGGERFDVGIGRLFAGVGK
jgi:hypothetical protein